MKTQKNEYRLKHELLQENKLKNTLSHYHKTRDTETKDKIVKFINRAEPRDLAEVFYDALVPETGRAETIAGEMIRAINKIGHIYYETQEPYFSGEGLDIAGSSAVYLSKINRALETLLIRIYPEQYLITTNKDKSYKNFITTLELRVIQALQENPDLILVRNQSDSSRMYKQEAEDKFQVYEEILNGDGLDIDDLDDFLESEDLL